MYVSKELLAQLHALFEKGHFSPQRFVLSLESQHFPNVGLHVACAFSLDWRAEGVLPILGL